MLDRSNDDWLAALRGTPDDEALLDLRNLLVRGLGFALADRLGADPEASIEDFAQESLLKILRSLDTFRGESQFTTWAQKIAVRVALTELRRRRWRDVSLEDLKPQRIRRAADGPARPGAFAGAAGDAGFADGHGSAHDDGRTRPIGSGRRCWR